jgi:hypothetical protein
MRINFAGRGRVIKRFIQDYYLASAFSLSWVAGIGWSGDADGILLLAGETEQDQYTAKVVCNLI